MSNDNNEVKITRTKGRSTPAQVSMDRSFR